MASTLNQAIATAVKRSWADIAKGGEASKPDASATLKPGRPGSLLCPCHGEVLMMLSHYGWLMVYGKVDHPSAGKHEGHVYVSTNDIVDGESLTKGDIVRFYLYADEKGIGAEMVEVEQLVDERRANAQKFIASGIPPALENESQPDAINIKSVADVSARLCKVFNLADLSDDEDDTCMESDYLDGGGSSHDGDAESSGDESDCSSIHYKAFDTAVAVPQLSPQCAKSKAQQALLSDASTTSGMSSDSEVESAGEWLAIGKVIPPCFRPPPGLSLPAGFRPPPGLSLW